MRRAARLVLLLGGLAVGWVVFRTRPHEVVLVYDLGRPGASGLTVDLLRGTDLVRHAEFYLQNGTQQVRHPVKLPDGEYHLRWVTQGGAAAQGERYLEVHEDGTQVLSLAP